MLVYKRIKDQAAYKVTVIPNGGADTEKIPEMCGGLPVTAVCLELGDKHGYKLRLPRFVEHFSVSGEGEGDCRIEIDPENPYLTTDGSAVFTKDMRLLLAFCARDVTSYTVPRGVRVIVRRAFEGSSALEEVVLPKTLRRIGDDAFAFCERLRRIDLENVEVFGERAFWGCFNLDNIRLNCRDIPRELFSDCYLLKTLSLENTRNIGEGAFDGTSMKKVTLPETVRSIGRYAFERSMERLVLPEKIEFVGELPVETVELTLSENSEIFSGKSDSGFREWSVLEIYSPGKELLCAAMDYDRGILRFCGGRKNLGFDFERYDKEIPLDEYVSGIYRAALFRVAHPYLLSELSRERYNAYLEKFAENYFERLFRNFWSDDNNRYLIMNIFNDEYIEKDAARAKFRDVCLRELADFPYCKYVSEDKLLSFIEISSARKDPELTALLLRKKFEAGNRISF